MTYIQQLLIICPLLFLAGFIDSIAGGGGLISIPAYLFAGVPMHYSLGTNKVTASLGTSLAAFRFIKSKNVMWNTALTSCIFSFIGSFLGSQIALLIDQDILKSCFVFILPLIAVFVVFKKSNVQEGVQKLFGTKMYIACAFIGLVIGMYDGLIGPGTGTFLIFAYTSIVGIDYITASGNAKIINLASNISAATSFILAGKVLWAIAIPVAFANIAGNWIGSGYAIKHGSAVIKKILVIVLIAIFFQLIMDIL